jgi:type II secretory pathway pseudopilin PulG
LGIFAMKARPDGFQLVELVFVLALLALLAAIAVPRIETWSARERVRLAAAELTSVLGLARSTAIRMSANVGVKFRTAPDGAVTFTVYRDGDGDGVRTADIERGIDPPVGSERRLGNLGRRVGFGLLRDPAPRDPGDPRRRLDDLDDPIRFNRSDIASFDPLGGATPGSLYVTDRREHLAVVRVLGATGRLKVLLYDREREVWER